MTGRLPEGLINIVAQEVQPPTPPWSSLDHDDAVSIEVLFRGWKTYSTTNRVTQGIVSARLQNIFWRLWSNRHLLPVTSASKLQELAYQVTQGDDRSWIPPPRPIFIVPRVPVVDEPVPGESSNQAHIPSAAEPETLTTSPVGILPSPNPPQSILKKSRSESDPRRKSVTVEAPALGESTEQILDSLAETLSSNSPPREGRASGSGTKKRSAFVTPTTAKSKTRPSIARRKSSQSNGEKSKGPKSPIKTSPGNILGSGSRSTAVPPIPPLPRVAANRLAAFEIPSASSWQSVDSESPAKLEKPEIITPPPALVIEPNFRDKFVENQRRFNSATNLAAAGRLGKSGSVVRFADEIPDDLRKGKEKEGSRTQRTSGRGSKEQDDLATVPRRNSGDSQVFEDEGESEDEVLELPRTKSQLSLQIESQRRQSGTREIGSPPSAQRQGSDKKKDEEDELIIMARSDGVTKAGGVAPGRNPHRISGTSEYRYRSPTPPPLY